MLPTRTGTPTAAPRRLRRSTKIERGRDLHKTRAGSAWRTRLARIRPSLRGRNTRRHKRERIRAAAARDIGPRGDRDDGAAGRRRGVGGLRDGDLVVREIEDEVGGAHEAVAQHDAVGVCGRVGFEFAGGRAVVEGEGVGEFGDEGGERDFD
jgi:hypothetical protein